MTQRQEGYSLTELMVVTLVIGILAAMAYPSYARQMVKARRVEAQLALVEAMQRQEQYRAQHHTYLAFSAASGDPDAGDFPWWIGNDPASSPYELDAYPCPGQDIAACVELRARPGTERVDTDFSDPECGVLTFDSTGAQGASGEAERCWP